MEAYEYMYRDSQEDFKPKSVILLNEEVRNLYDESPYFAQEKLKPRTYFAKSRFPVISKSPHKPRTRERRCRNYTSDPKHVRQTNYEVPKFRNSLYKEFQFIRYKKPKCHKCSQASCSCSRNQSAEVFDVKFQKYMKEKSLKRSRLFNELNSELKQKEIKIDQMF